VKIYWESQEKEQSHTHFSVLLLSVFRRLKSAVDQILQVPSAEAVASRLIGKGRDGGEEEQVEGRVKGGNSNKEENINNLAYLESGLKTHLTAYLLWACFFILGVRVMGLVPTPLERLHT